VNNAWWEYAVRFVFGGAITVAAGLIAKAFGPGIGGLFLAFPAILPASVTLVKRHAGQDSAGVDSLGAAFGSLGLIPFAAIVWAFGASGSPWLILLGATAAWVVASIALWVLLRGSIRQVKPR
jgi:hypothetical protein